MNKIVKIIAFMMPIQMIYGQSPTEKGYIITLNNDTLSGLLKVYEDNTVYRKSVMIQGSKETTFTPTDVKGYGFFGGSRYSSDLQDTFCYIIGNTNKFDILKAYNNFYLKTKNGKMVRLISEKKIMYNDKLKANVEVENQSWRQTLKTNSSDCKSMDSYIKSMQLFERPLVLFLEKYSKCTGETATFSNDNQPWIKTKVGFISGISYSILNFAKSGYEFNRLNRCYDKIVPSIGLVLEHSYPRTRTKWKIQQELHYSFESYHDTVLTKNTLSTKYYANSLKHHSLTNILEGKYNIGNKSVYSNLHVGMNFTFYVKSKISTHETEVITPQLQYNKDYDWGFKLSQSLGPSIGYSIYKNRGKYPYGLIARYIYCLVIGNEVNADLDNHKIFLGATCHLN